MTPPEPGSGLKSGKFAFLILACAVLLVYSNTFHASWHLDDFENIVTNPGIRISELSFESLKQACFAAPAGGAIKHGALYRPLPMVSFALNWYLGQDRVFGYHLVNIFIHVAASWFLYLTFVHLFRTPGLRHLNLKNPSSLALLLALIWAVHPIQTQAITYIVQRMASMAGMFFIFTMYAYLRLRLSSRNGSKIGWGTLTVLGASAALLCKENAITILPTLVLMEVALFWEMDSPRRRQFYWLAVGGIVLAAIFLGAALILGMINPGGIMDNYEMRSYTPWQRILTQGRVLWIYLYKIMVPLGGHYALEYDILVSQGLTQPWTTLPGVGGILFFIGLGFWAVPRLPWLGFPILFFFVAHSVESTILPLELVFEHRNYIPGMFLFLPVAVGLSKWMTHWRPERLNGLLTYGLTGGLVVFMVGICLATYSRNFDWRDEVAFWADALEKAPYSARAHQNYAYALMHRTRNPDLSEVEALYKKAVDLRVHKNRAYAQAVSYSNLSALYNDMGRGEDSLAYARKALRAVPRSKFLLQYFKALLRNDQPERVLAILAKNKGRYQNRPDFLLVESRALFALGQWEKAWAMIQEMVVRFSDIPHVHLHRAGLLIAMEKYSQAIAYIDTLLKDTRVDLRFPFRFLRLEARLRSENMDAFGAEMRAMVDRVGMDVVRDEIRIYGNRPLPFVILSRERMNTFLDGELRADR